MADSDRSVSRRRFIQSAIAGGAGVASANYLFRAATRGDSVASDRLITLNVNGQLQRVDAMKQTVIAAARLALIFMVTGCGTDPMGMASAASISVAACSSAAHQTRTWAGSSPRALPMRVCRASNVSRLRSTL
jgi:hypothetical protein